MKETSEGCTAEESRALCADNRLTDELLRDHIRAVCAEMREKADMHGELDEVGYYTSLRRFADRLEGKQ